jgi:flagellar biosynthesis/type III secretory pathway protein FliH
MNDEEMHDAFEEGYEKGYEEGFQEGWEEAKAELIRCINLLDLAEYQKNNIGE